jgi:DNA-binding SARP family transcriptional activator
MYLEILGPLAMRGASEDITPTAAKPQQMLALLALNNGRMVPVSNLLDELWEDEPPRSARTTLHTYVLQVRRMLSAGTVHDVDRREAKAILTTCQGGYRLQLREDEIDTVRFESLSRQGSKCYDDGHMEEAADLLGQALQVWRGPALAGLNPGPPLRAEIARLETQRLVVLDRRLRAELGCGMHGRVLGELSGLVVSHPMHENLHELLMVALYRSGRRLQALDAFRTLRRQLRDEVGLEPGGPIQRLHQAIIDDDPRLGDTERPRMLA